MGDFGEWHVGDPIGFGNDTGAPEVPYMSYGPKGDREKNGDSIPTPEEIENDRRKKVSKILAREASRLYNEGRIDEARVLVDISIENWKTVNNWNLKAIMVEDDGQFEEAIKYYDKALDMNSSDEIVLHNKALCLLKFSRELFSDQYVSYADGRLDIAMDIFSKIDDKESLDEVLDLKAQIAVANRQYGKALDFYKHALEFVGDDSELRAEYARKRDALLKYFDETEIKCPRCGNIVPITDSYCMRCGIRIDLKKLK